MQSSNLVIRSRETGGSEPWYMLCRCEVRSHKSHLFGRQSHAHFRTNIASSRIMPLCLAAIAALGVTAHRAAIFAMREASTMREASRRQMHVHVFAGPTAVIGVTDGSWKGLSVQFTSGSISSVEMHHGTAGQITVQHTSSDPGFFQAADLSGAGLSWPNGLAATVNFEEGTDVSVVNIDYSSINTYVIQLADPTCVSGAGHVCEVAPATYFSDTQHPPSVVAFSGIADAFEVYVFAEASSVMQASIGFSQAASASSWSLEDTLPPMQIVNGNSAFGIWRADGGFVPTGVPLTTLVAVPGACVIDCLDVTNSNSNMEDTSRPARFYDVIFVHGTTLTPASACDRCGYVDSGGDASECAAADDGSTCMDPNGSLCYVEAPRCSCDAVGSGGVPEAQYAGFAASCTPSASACVIPNVNGFGCFTMQPDGGSVACLPTASMCFTAAPAAPPRQPPTPTSPPPVPSPPVSASPPSSSPPSPASPPSPSSHEALSPAIASAPSPPLPEAMPSFQTTLTLLAAGSVGEYTAAKQREIAQAIAEALSVPVDEMTVHVSSSSSDSSTTSSEAAQGGGVEIMIELRAVSERANEALRNQLATAIAPGGVVIRALAAAGVSDVTVVEALEADTHSVTMDSGGDSPTGVNAGIAAAIVAVGLVVLVGYACRHRCDRPLAWCPWWWPVGSTPVFRRHKHLVTVGGTFESGQPPSPPSPVASSTVATEMSGADDHYPVSHI